MRAVLCSRGMKPRSVPTMSAMMPKPEAPVATRSGSPGRLPRQLDVSLEAARAQGMRRGGRRRVAGVTARDRDLVDIEGVRRAVVEPLLEEYGGRPVRVEGPAVLQCHGELPDRHRYARPPPGGEAVRVIVGDSHLATQSLRVLDPDEGKRPGGNRRPGISSKDE